MQGWFNIQKLMLTINHINRQEQQNHIIISVDTEKASNKIQHPFMTVIISKLATVPQLHKKHFKNTTDQIISDQSLSRVQLYATP